MFRASHRYLRAYLAGIALPTVFLLVLLCVFVTLAANGVISWSLSSLLIFPMAVVPNLWGVWNMTYAGLSRGRRLNLGLFGALLPCIVAPCGYLMAGALGHPIPLPFGTLAAAFCLAVLMYYLVWKYFVHFLNEILEVEDL